MSLLRPGATVTLLARHSSQGLEAGMRETLLAIVAYLREQGAVAQVEQKTAQSVKDVPVVARSQIATNSDLVIVLGGDGTTIGIARELAGSKVPLVSINYGRVGFITDIPHAQWQEYLPPILAGQYQVDERLLITGSVLRDGAVIYRGSALNDIVLVRSGGSAMLEWAIEVDGAFMVESRGDGLIIATPTGSTAYSLSLGGPILHPHLPGLVLTAIAPHALANRPIIVPQDATITITLENEVPASVNFDMQSYTALQSGDKISIHVAAERALFLHPLEWNYYQTLRQKFYWHFSPHAAPPA